MIRAIIDDRVARAWAILFGMFVMATTVGVATVILHDRVGVIQSVDAKFADPNPVPSANPATIPHPSSSHS
jgi:hypothetical protein